MRIIVFCGYYHPHKGGYCKNTHELAKRLVARGHSVDVVTCNTESSPPTEVIDGVQVIRLPVLVKMSEFPIPAPGGMLWSLFKRNYYDVAITQSRIFLTTVLGDIYSLTKHIPLIHVERGGQHTVTRNPLFTWMMKVYDHTIGHAIIGDSFSVVAISEASCVFVVHLNNKTPTRIIYNGINVPDLMVMLPPWLNDGGHRTDIVFAGRLIYGKGVQDLITAFETINAKHKETFLRIIGDGPYRWTLEEQATHSPAADHINFLGEVAQEEIVETIGDGHIFVNPSYSEGMPTSVLEAASVGMPIIATDVGGTREIIRDGVTGYLVPPKRPVQIAETIELIMSDWRKAEAVGKLAREAAKQLDWSMITDQWEELLEEAVSIKRKE